VTNKCSAKIQAALDSQVSGALDLLREQLSENHLLGEIL
jgi:hypothetical protein